MKRFLLILIFPLTLTAVKVNGQLVDSLWHKKDYAFLYDIRDFLGVPYDSATWITIVNKGYYNDSIFTYSHSIPFIGNTRSSQSGSFFINNMSKLVEFSFCEGMCLGTINFCFFSNNNLIKWIMDGYNIDSTLTQFKDVAKYHKDELDIQKRTRMKQIKLNNNDKDNIIVTFLDTLIKEIHYTSFGGSMYSQVENKMINMVLSIHYTFIDEQLITVFYSYRNLLGNEEETEKCEFSNGTMTKWTVNGVAKNNKTQEYIDKETSINKKVNEFITIAKINK